MLLIFLTLNNMLSSYHKDVKIQENMLFRVILDVH